MLMGPIVMQSEDSGGHHVCVSSPQTDTVTVPIVCLLEQVWGQSSEPLLSRDGGDPAAATATAQPAPLHDEGWRKCPGYMAQALQQHAGPAGGAP